MSRIAAATQTKQQLVHLYRKALLAGMSLDEIEEKVGRHVARIEVNDTIETHDESVRAEKVKRAVPRVVRLGSILVPLVFITVGLYLIGSAVVPILGYYVQTAPQLKTAALTAPIPQEQVMEITPLVLTQGVEQVHASDGAAEGPVIIDEALDYTNLAHWFDEDQLPQLEGSGAVGQALSEYTIDIPKIKIANAKVAVGGTDLNHSLIAYPGTALPGQPGAPVIFGHSVLRSFYNPSEKNPRRYNSIFSTIMTLQPGDKIFVTANGVKYTYVVQAKTEVKPSDVYILTQQYDAKRLKLVTCTPEGTYLRRGVVTAQLVESGS